MTLEANSSILHKFMPKNLTSPFSLDIIQKDSSVEIVMNLGITSTGTEDFPKTKQVLEKLLPTIYNHKCLNGEKLPFSEEIVETEIGHLFEHIIMEYLHQLKSHNGCKSNKVKGETIWDWNKEKRGIFHILLDSPKSEVTILSSAISKATDLMTKILKTAPSPSTFDSITYPTSQLSRYTFSSKSSGNPKNND